MAYDFYSPGKVLFGAGRLNDLYKEDLPGKKALLVISNGKSTRENGALDRTIDQLVKAGVEYHLFPEIMANPLVETVNEGAKVATLEGCDFVVALGGGSVLDASKGIAIAATNSGNVWDYINGGTGGRMVPENAPLPIVAITTTAGTGSEVDGTGVISNTKTNEKIAVVNPQLIPRIAIVDPELMRTVPPKFTAMQGFDALFHSTEGYISNVSNIMSEMVQRTAIENVGKYLARAVRNGDDMEAREHMAFANTLSGYSMVASSCASKHAMEHAMSAYHHNLPHGAGLILIAVEYYKFIIGLHVCDERFVDMARWLGRTEATEPMEFVEALQELMEECGVADMKMSDYGMTVDECDTFATCAKETMYRTYSKDRHILSHDECAEIFRRSFR